MKPGLDWQRDGPRWPHHALSSFVWASGLQWHVQRFAGPEVAPCLVLLHGTGASTHSWRDLAPLLAQRFEVVAMDLPGHAFTGMPPGGVGSPQLSLPGMARAVHGLLQALRLSPSLVVGHSAGAAGLNCAAGAITCVEVTSGSAQTNLPITFGQPFRADNVAHHPN